MTLFLLIASEQKVYVPYISYLKYYHIKTSEYVLMTLINVPLPAMFISCLFNWSSLKKNVFMVKCIDADLNVVFILIIFFFERVASDAI